MLEIIGHNSLKLTDMAANVINIMEFYLGHIMMIDQIKQGDSNSILCLKISDIAVDKINNYI